MAYHPIESYGVIGDLHSVALIGPDGSIDWCCLPDFDSPSVFARILDDQIGGYYKISSPDCGRVRQMYLPETNVLLTRFYGDEALGEMTDFMPVHTGRRGARNLRHQVIRMVKVVRGRMQFRLECAPAFDYARAEHKIVQTPQGVVFESGGTRLALISPVPLSTDGERVVAQFELGPEECATFVLRHQEGGDSGLTEPLSDPEEELNHTLTYWRAWLSKSQYRGRWREMVERSALVLKLLTYQPTGAIVAAPTTSLPEEIGGVRNWDYRYTWIRDAAFSIYGLIRLGFTSEAAEFMSWLQNRIHEEDSVDGPLQVLYLLDGRHNAPEIHLDHLSGYRNSKPVRIGNLAAKQFQLDIYGALIDSIYLFDKYHTRISYDLWRQVLRMLDFVVGNWQRPDDGIWEVRGGQQQFVYSKLQCWVALDRGLRMALKYGLPIDFVKIRNTHDEIYHSIMSRGYNQSTKSFVQHFDTDALDAANLLMPLVHFVSPRDPRMLNTIDRTIEELSFGSLVHRYDIGKAAGDGLTGHEGTFSMCSFWMVEALTRAGRLEEARLNFEKMLTYANHLGLYAEEIGPSGEALGNFPQAFTHLALISAAFNLDRALG